MRVGGNGNGDIDGSATDAAAAAAALRANKTRLQNQRNGVEKFSLGWEQGVQ